MKEYWIVDPTHLYVDQFIHKDGQYLFAKTYVKTDTLHSELFDWIKIDVERVFKRLLVFDKE